MPYNYIIELTIWITKSSLGIIISPVSDISTQWQLSLKMLPPEIPLTLPHSTSENDAANTERLKTIAIYAIQYLLVLGMVVGVQFQPSIRDTIDSNSRYNTFYSDSVAVLHGLFSVLILIAALAEPANNHKTETSIILLSILGFAYFFSNFLSKDQGLRSLFIWFCALVLVLICRKARELFHHRKNNPTANPISNDNLGAEVNNSDTDTTNHSFNASPEHVTGAAATSLEVESSRLNADVSGRSSYASAEDWQLSCIS